MRMSRAISFTLLAGMLFLAAVYAEPTPVFPGTDWQEATPESQGIDSTRLSAAVDYLRANTPRHGVDELVIVRHGYLVWQGLHIDRVHGTWSCTKSFTSTVLGLLIDDGRVTLDTRVRDVLPGMALYPDVTFRHLTTMTSGYRAEGDTAAGWYSWGPSPTPFVPSPTPLFTPPGTKFAYWDSAMNQLAHALTRVAGEPIAALFKRRIADPIQMQQDRWAWGDFGVVDGLVVNGGAGNHNADVHISARELARLGHLFLHRGQWQGRQLISAAWVDAATWPQVPLTTPVASPELSLADGRGTYGFNWWSNGSKDAGRPLWPGAPASTYAARGFNNNRLFVIPAWDMVVVRLGQDQAGGFRISDLTWNEFLRRLSEALLSRPDKGQ
jgi:CubicO group peptidase (beta-lactamase class C family)